MSFRARRIYSFGWANRGGWGARPVTLPAYRVRCNLGAVSVHRHLSALSNAHDGFHTLQRADEAVSEVRRAPRQRGVLNRLLGLNYRVFGACHLDGALNY